MSKTTKQEPDLWGARLLGLAALAGLCIAVSTVFQSNDAVPVNDAVATVNDVPISRTAYARALSVLAQDKKDALTPADRKQALNMLIQEELLIQRSQEIDLVSVDPSIRKALTGAMVQFIIAENGATDISEDSLRAHYAARLDHFTPSLQARVKRIYVRGARQDAAERLKQIRQALRNQEDFDSVNKRLGDEIFPQIPDTLLPPAKLRDYLGPALSETALTIQEGNITNAIRIGSGWHFLYVVQRRKGEAPAFDTIREQVKNDFIKSSEETALREYIQWLTNRAKITRHLPQPVIDADTGKLSPVNDR